VPPSEQVRFGAIGVKGMGWANAQSFLKIPGFRCAALCDVDASGIVGATDALALLRVVVGVGGVLDCATCE